MARGAIGGPLMRCALALAAIAPISIAPRRARADETCAIEGTLTGVAVTIYGERGIRRVRLEQATRVAVTPVRNGVTRIRTLDAPIFEGTTRAPLRFVLARAIELRGSTVELPEGLAIDRFTVSPNGPWLEVDASLGDGLFLHRTPLPCSALVATDADRAIVPLPGARAPVGPRWHVRTTRLYLFDREDGEEPFRLEVAPAAAARFVELERRGPWVRVALHTTAGSRMRGWVHDWDLVQ